MPEIEDRLVVYIPTGESAEGGDRGWAKRTELQVQVNEKISRRVVVSGGVGWATSPPSQSKNLRVCVCLLDKSTKKKREKEKKKENWRGNEVHLVKGGGERGGVTIRYTGASYDSHRR